MKLPGSSSVSYHQQVITGTSLQECARGPLDPEKSRDPESTAADVFPVSPGLPTQGPVSPGLPAQGPGSRPSSDSLQHHCPR